MASTTITVQRKVSTVTLVNQGATGAAGAFGDLTGSPGDNAAIDPGWDALLLAAPAIQVTSGEKITGTETALRRFAPDDVRAMVQIHALTVKLDDLSTPDDNTDLDASLTEHGLLPKLGGGTTNFLRADGTWSPPPGAGGGIGSVLEDTTPQLGGQLDVNGNAIGDGTLELLTFTEDGAAVNHINIENQSTGAAPIISAVGDDANVDLRIHGKAAGNVLLSDGTDVTKSIEFDVSGASTTMVMTIASPHTASRTLTLPDATDTLVGKATTDIFTNKSIDANGTGNSITNIETPDVATASKTGLDTKFVTGTEGSTGNLAMWDVNGDAIDSTVSAAFFDQSVTTVASPTFIGLTLSGLASLNGLTLTGLLNAQAVEIYDGLDVLSGGLALTGDMTVTGTVDGIDIAGVSAVFNAAALDTPAITITENAGTVYLNLEKNGTGDIRFVFSDGIHTHDCTPIAQVALTAGSDISPQMNYVYILQSTKALTVSTSAFPAAEHAPIATVLVQSAASVATDGPYKAHAWTDHVAGSDSQGHLAHLNYWVRQQHATWATAVVLSTSVGASTFDISTTAGSVLQLHPHIFPAFDTATGSDVYVVNDPDTAYNKVGDLLLASVGKDINGTVLGGPTTDFYNLVIWGVVNEATGDCKLMCNVPDGAYSSNNDSVAEDDVDNTAIYDIPSDFRGVGFLIARLTVQENAGTYSIIKNTDLRGLFPSTSAGGGAVGGNEFADNVFRIQDDGDPTKELDFQLGGGTTGFKTTLVCSATGFNFITIPDTVADTLVGKATTDIFTNKSIDQDGTGNSITNIANASIKAAAAIAYSKLNLTGAILNADLAGSIAAAKISGTALTKAQEFTKGITIEDPTASEDITIWYTKNAITLTEVHAVLPNGSATPTVTYQIKHHTDRSNAGNNGTTSAAVTSTTTGTDATLSDATVPADSFIWIETTAQGGTVPAIHVSLAYTID